MEDVDPSSASTIPQKRALEDDTSPAKNPLNLKGTQFVMPTPPDTDQSSNASPNCNNQDSVRDVSPAPSSTTLSSCETMTTNPAHNAGTAIDLTSTMPTTSTSDQPPQKKRKLTSAEKEDQRMEKEAKAAEKAAEKARKDAEKAAEKVRKDQEKARKDDEKRVKDEVKRKKAEEREAEKRTKELDAERKIQDKLKKERSQMRLGAFFQKPATPAREPGMTDDGAAPYSTARRKSLSLEPFDATADQGRRSESPCNGATQAATAKSTPLKPSISDYKKYFLPFQLQTHTTMAEFRVSENPQRAQEDFDREIHDPSLREKYEPSLIESYAGLKYHFAEFRQSSRGISLPSVRRLCQRIQGSIQDPIDLTCDSTALDPMDELQIVSRRHIEFHEDVRPAYFGTYTRVRSPRASRKLSRDPFSRTRTDTDYDYDSEAEWEESEEGEEGEELLDEDDNEAESVGDAHEFDEFLDDEEDEPKKKRKLITGDLVPKSSGLCWEDESGRIVPSTKEGSSCQWLHEMRIGILLPGFTGHTIDPFSTAYWEPDPAPVQPASAPKAEQPAGLVSSLMPPPRQPLQSRLSGNGTLDHLLPSDLSGGDASSTGAAPTRSAKPQRKSMSKPLSSEDMEEFKGFVVGSTASKADLLKELKTRFPKFTNETIKTTLSDGFAQVGASKAEKKWGIVSMS